MISQRKIEVMMSQLLTIGMISSLLLVIVGGALYLKQFGGEMLQAELLQASSDSINIKNLWQQITVLSPLSLIEIGLLLLVATQLLRVLLLVCFYTIIADYWFMGFSFFILLTLLYSLVFYH